MRIRVTLLTGALLLASTLAMAQQTPQTPSQPGQTTDAVAVPQQGNFDFGFRAGSFDGDQARFARYSDYRDKQAGINFKWDREAANYFVKLRADNVGYYDQAFLGQFVNSKLHASVEWNQTPLFYGAADQTKSAYHTQSIANGVATLTLDDATRQLIQSKTTYTYDKYGQVSGATQSNSALGVITNMSTQTGGNLWRNQLVGTDVRSRRDDLKMDLVYQASRDVDVKFGVNSYSRNGTQPWGAAFAFTNGVELPLPIDNRTTNLEGHLEWANRQGMMKVGWEGSYFDNNITTLVWNNPLRATDGWNGSAYNNGALPSSAWGRMALAPNNSSNTINAVGMYKLPKHSSFNASLAVTSLSQNDALLPFTINTTLQPGTQVSITDATTGVKNTWTLVAPERSNAEADVRLTVGTVNFTTRPNRMVGFTAKYRYSDWNNRTPILGNQYNVRFDGAPENVPGSETEPGNIKYQTFDGDATFTPVPVFAFRVGFGREGRDLTYRSNLGYNENTFRVAVDTIGNQFVTLRAKYEIMRRDANSPGTLLRNDGEEEVWASAVGAQPTSAQFDVASRDRNRATLVFDVTPVPVVGLSLSVFRGTDKYPDITYGLLNNNNTGVTFGIDLMPSNFATVNFYYGYEKYDSLQASNTAGPAATGAALAAGNWNLNNNERVDNYGATIQLTKLIPKTEINFGWDYSKSDQAFIYGGARIDALSALASAYPTIAPGSQFQPLPNVGNKLQSAGVDFKYFITPKVAVGANYLHQKYDVADWQASGTVGTYTYDPIGGNITSYGLRPYNANVGGVRVIYLF